MTLVEPGRLCRSEGCRSEGFFSPDCKSAGEGAGCGRGGTNASTWHRFFSLAGRRARGGAAMWVAQHRSHLSLAFGAIGNPQGLARRMALCAPPGDVKPRLDDEGDAGAVSGPRGQEARGVHLFRVVGTRHGCQAGREAKCGHGAAGRWVGGGARCDSYAAGAEGRGRRTAGMLERGKTKGNR